MKKDSILYNMGTDFTYMYMVTSFTIQWYGILTDNTLIWIFGLSSWAVSFFGNILEMNNENIFINFRGD